MNAIVTDTSQGVSDNRDECVSCQVRTLISVYWGTGCTKSSVSKQLETIHILFEHCKNVLLSCKSATDASEVGWRTNSLNGHGDPDDQLAWMLGIMRSEMPSR